MHPSRLLLLAMFSFGFSSPALAGDDTADKSRGTIAFASQTPRGWDLYVANVKARTSARLTEHPSLDFNAAVSPDGKRVAFVSERNGNMEIYSMNADGSEPRRKWLVFASGYAGTSVEAVSLPRTDEPFGELFAIRLDGTGLIRLTHNGSSEDTPEWGSLPR